MFTKTLSGTYMHVWSSDPAIKKDAPEFDHAAYIRTGDESHLPLNPGARPVKFVLRHLVGAELNELRSLVVGQDSTPVKVAYKAAALAIDSIDGFIVDGAEEEVSHYRDRGGLRWVSPKTMNILYQVPALVEEIGMRVISEEITGDPL